jgi:hypothetical protein
MMAVGVGVLSEHTNTHKNHTDTCIHSTQIHTPTLDFLLPLKKAKKHRKILLPSLVNEHLGRP